MPPEDAVTLAADLHGDIFGASWRFLSCGSATLNGHGPLSPQATMAKLGPILLAGHAIAAPKLMAALIWLLLNLSTCWWRRIRIRLHPRVVRTPVLDSLFDLFARKLFIQSAFRKRREFRIGSEAQPTELISGDFRDPGTE